ncbi:MAG: hypothetical protein Q4P05_06315 [Actinomycetaceae bacterium]|nr:hypothetical protein [Actinomycetaceae bacterium]
MSDSITASAQLVDAVKKASRAVVVIAIAVTVIFGAIAAFIAGRPSGIAALVGGVVGVFLALITVFTMGLAMKRLEMQSAFMVGDYLFKFLILVLTLIVTRGMEFLDSRALGLTVLVSIVAQSAVQMWILARAKIPTIDQANSAQE